MCVPWVCQLLALSGENHHWLKAHHAADTYRKQDLILIRSRSGIDCWLLVRALKIQDLAGILPRLWPFPGSGGSWTCDWTFLVPSHTFVFARAQKHATLPVPISLMVSGHISRHTFGPHDGPDISLSSAYYAKRTYRTIIFTFPADGRFLRNGDRLVWKVSVLLRNFIAECLGILLWTFECTAGATIYFNDFHGFGSFNTQIEVIEARSVAVQNAKFWNCMEGSKNCPLFTELKRCLLMDARCTFSVAVRSRKLFRRF